MWESPPPPPGIILSFEIIGTCVGEGESFLIRFLSKAILLEVFVLFTFSVSYFNENNIKATAGGK